MGASLFIGMNDNGQKPSNFQRTGGFVNGDYWDAFGDLLDEVFLLNYPYHLNHVSYYYPYCLLILFNYS